MFPKLVLLLVVYIFLIGCSSGCMKVYTPSEIPMNLTDIKLPWYKEEWLLPKQVKTRKLLPYKCQCGIENKETGQEEIPWTVWVTFWTKFPTGNKYEVKCGGTVINDKMILTNAKCADSFKFSLSSASYQWDSQRINVWLNSPPPSQLPANSIPITNVFFHPEYLKGDLGKDVALIQLKDSVPFKNPNNAIRPICIPALKDTIPEVVGTQAGFIYHKLAGSNNTAQYINQKATAGLVYNILECKKMFKEKIRGSHFICSGPGPAEKDIPVPRLFGSPLYLPLSNDQDIQTGVWSSRHYGLRKNENSMLNLFIRIQEIVPFIEETSNKINARWCRHPRIKFNQSVPESYTPESETPWIGTTSEGREVNPGCVCGYKKRTQVQGRIVGGHDAIPYTFPWLVNLQVAGGGTLSGCGAAIINNFFILTAAHCLFNKELATTDAKYKGYAPSDLSLTILSHFAENDQNAVTLQNEVEEVFLHPDFSASFVAGTTTDYDVAMLKLNSPLDFWSDEGPLPICLPSTGEKINVIGHEAIVVGWGMTNPDDENESAKELQQLEIPVKNLRDCTDLAVMPITNRMLCAGTFNPRKDTLHGDSGGPLMFELATKQMTEIGIVSWGDFDIRKANSLDQESAAALYTNVTAVLDYIDYFTQLHGAKWCRKEAAPRNPRRPWLGAKLPPRKISTSCVCGKRVDASAAGNIMSGMEKNAMPFLVLIMAVRQSGTKYCTGTIINSMFIITSPSCVVSDQVVKHGKPSLPRNVIFIQPMGFTFNFIDFQSKLIVDDIHIHPGFFREGSEFDHDIALIKLKEPIDFEASKLAPICIPTQEDLKRNLTTKGFGTISGWQKLQQQRQTIFKLDFSVTDLSLRKLDACGKQEYQYLNKPRTFICLENKKSSGRDPSMTGGPLVIPKSNDQYYQIGVIPDLETEKKVKCPSKKKKAKKEVAKHKTDTKDNAPLKEINKQKVEKEGIDTDDGKKTKKKKVTTEGSVVPPEDAAASSEDKETPAKKRSYDLLQSLSNSIDGLPKDTSQTNPNFWNDREDIKLQRLKRETESQCSMFTAISDDVLQFIEFFSYNYNSTWCESELPIHNDAAPVDYGV